MTHNLAEIAKHYEALIRRAQKTSEAFELKLEFYPYVGINNRIRIRGSLIHVKLSDILMDAPIEFHAALAEILVHRLFRKRVSLGSMEIYRDYIKRSEVRDRSIAVRKKRGRKMISGSDGSMYDLSEIFDMLNQIYFANAIKKPQLTWSAAGTFRILGHHDATHETIVISKTLDDIRVPRFVVEYVVYHEMLHIKHPTRYENGRRYSHTAAFRRDERDFAFFDAAEEWIDKNAANLKKRAKKSNAK